MSKRVHLIRFAHRKKLETNLFTPISMGSCHADAHLSKISNLLSLEPIEIRLYRGARILEILS